MVRPIFTILVALCACVLTIAWFWPPALWAFLVLAPLIALAIWDVHQTKHAVLRNFPIIGHFRYLFEMIRPEIMQYFIETNTDGQPFSREQRSVVYQRAKKQIDTLPFGTQRDVYEVGYEWIHHSIAPTHPRDFNPRITVGKTQCAQPYELSIFNVSAMSFGSLSANAVLALNEGARLAGFAHNTGEGGVSPYHLEPGGDLIWQLGTGYFGARSDDGGFDRGKFREVSQISNIKMIEIKLSQGAKPGHGGILPGRKVTPEIARIRGVRVGMDVLSPPGHSAFGSPLELVHFIAELRELSGGKPIGIKLCVGKRRQFAAICKAMLETGITPDYVAVDGGEGGTGAAPLEFSNSIGMPLNEGLVFVHNTLVGSNLRDRVKIGASGKIVTGFSLLSKLALGADFGYSARGMMFAIGCIQALRCNTNDCPTGVATQRPELMRGLVPGDKAHRVAHFHQATLHAFTEILAAAGVERHEDLRPWHIHRRISETESRHLAQVYNYIEPGSLLESPLPIGFARVWTEADYASW
ncbi:MAG: FMN-binding glutamate synthase family protein [Planctomycetes bacterium]|nr:FMN-binding glutamate synthase family protein [Planctomycetota bacterium]